MRADGADAACIAGHSCDAASSPFVQALKAFRHPCSGITAAALAIFALGDPLAGGLGDVAGRLS